MDLLHNKQVFCPLGHSRSGMSDGCNVHNRIQLGPNLDPNEPHFVVCGNDSKQKNLCIILHFFLKKRMVAWVYVHALPNTGCPHCPPRCVGWGNSWLRALCTQREDRRQDTRHQGVDPARILDRARYIVRAGEDRTQLPTSSVLWEHGCSTNTALSCTPTPCWPHAESSPIWDTRLGPSLWLDGQTL